MDRAKSSVFLSDCTGEIFLHAIVEGYRQLFAGRNGSFEVEPPEASTAVGKLVDHIESPGRTKISEDGRRIFDVIAISVVEGQYGEGSRQRTLRKALRDIIERYDVEHLPCSVSTVSARNSGVISNEAFGSNSLATRGRTWWNIRIIPAPCVSGRSQRSAPSAVMAAKPP